MKKVSVITPVKDSIQSTLQTVEAIKASVGDVEIEYTVYNDFSIPENTRLLEEASKKYDFNLVNLADLTDHPSPNYLFVLKRVRKEALKTGVPVLIVESDVTVEPGTIAKLVDGASERPDCGIAAAVTVDAEGKVNYPYLFAKDLPKEVVPTKKHCSFCCSLLTLELLEKVDFDTLDPGKHWFDVTISHRCLESGLRNYLFMNAPVVHRPHQSRPWKQLKYTNPLKYYWIKFTKGFDKI